MVFGWGKKKTEKQETSDANKEKSIKLSEIKTTLDDISLLRTQTAVAEVKSFKKKIEANIDEVLKIANQLKQDDLKADEFDKRLQVIVVRGKEEVISTIQNEGKIKFPEIKSYDDVLEFNDKASQTLKKIGDVLGKNSKIIHIFAKKYATKLKDILAILTSDQSEVQKLVNVHLKLQNNIAEVSSKIAQIKELQRTLAEKKNRTEEHKKNIEECDKKIKAYKEEIDKIHSSQEYSEFLKLQKTIDVLENEKNQIKDEINTQFTKISRPLSRYEYVSSFDKPQKQLLEKLVAEPYEVLNSTNKENIVRILQAAKIGVQAGSVSVKDNEKTISNIDETILLLDNHISKIMKLSKKKESTEKNLANFDNQKLESIEKELAKNLSDKRDAELKIQNLVSEISEINKKIPALVTDIEIILRTISDTKYQVTG